MAHCIPQRTTPESLLLRIMSAPTEKQAQVYLDDENKHQEKTAGDNVAKLHLNEEDGSLGETGDEDAPPAVVIPWKYRLAAIVLIILFGTGNTYAGFVLGPLKTRLVRELKISSKLWLDCHSVWKGPWS